MVQADGEDQVEDAKEQPPEKEDVDPGAEDGAQNRPSRPAQHDNTQGEQRKRHDAQPGSRDISDPALDLRAEGDEVLAVTKLLLSLTRKLFRRYWRTPASSRDEAREGEPSARIEGMAARTFSRKI